MTKTNKFQELDDAIIEHVAFDVWHPIYSIKLAKIALPLLANHRTPFPSEWRLIDRRMQALRKAGRLAYLRGNGGHGRWTVVGS